MFYVVGTMQGMLDPKNFIPEGTCKHQLCSKAQLAKTTLVERQKSVDAWKALYYKDHTPQEARDILKTLGALQSPLLLSIECNVEKGCRCKFKHDAYAKTLKFFWLDEKKKAS